MSKLKHMIYIFQFAGILLVSACGGGGGGGGTSPPPPPMDPVSVYVNNAILSEGNGGTSTMHFLVKLTKTIGTDVSMQFETTDGSAVAGEDYDAVAGALTISAGQQQGIIEVPIHGDLTVEDDQSFTMSLSNLSSNATFDLSTATGTILNDDVEVAAQLSIDDANINEGDSGTTAMVFMIHLSRDLDTDVTLDYATSDGTALAGADYEATNGSFSIPAHETTASIVVLINGDTDPETDQKSFNLALSNLSANASFADSVATGTIYDDDNGNPPVIVTINDVSMNEGDVGDALTMTFSVNLSVATSSDVSMEYVTRDGTAVENEDYIPISGTLSIPAGNTSSTIDVTINGDATIETNQTFFVNLSNLSINASFSKDMAIGTILNDDVEIPPQLNVQNSIVNEGDSGTSLMTFTVSLSRPLDGGDVTVDYATIDGDALAAEDYEAASGSLTIPSGTTTATVEVTIYGDTEPEADQYFSLELNNLSENATFGTNSATGTIVNDDVTNPPTLEDLGSVTAVFPGNGSQWNDYVAGDSIVTASDVICDPNAGASCLHAGELRQVNVSARTSCTNLTATDALNAFVWECDDSGSNVVFRSMRLDSGKYLSSLLDFDALTWRTNQVTVFDNGLPWGHTDMAIWWGNPIIEDNDGGELNVAGTIYLITNPVLATGYTIESSKISLVSKPATTILATLNGDNVIAIDVRSGERDFIWLESSIDANGIIDYGVYADGLRYSSIQNTKVLNAISTGLFLKNSTLNTLVDISADKNGLDGIGIHDSSKIMIKNVNANDNESSGVILSYSNLITISNIEASNNQFYGVYLFEANENKLTNIIASNNDRGIVLEGGVVFNISQNIIGHVVASNNASDGVYLTNSFENILFDVLASNNQNYGINLPASYRNSLLAISTTNNAIGGIYLAGNTNVLESLVVGNNGEVGLMMVNADFNIIGDIAAADNGTGSGVGIYLTASANNNVFTGILAVGQLGPNCFVEEGGASPGMDDDVDPTDVATDTFHSNYWCTPEGASDFSFVPQITLADSFVGKLSDDDLVNSSDIPEGTDYPIAADLFDWNHFDNRHRTWGIEGGVFPAYDNRGQWLSGIGRIWDWSLVSSDNIIRGVNFIPTANDTFVHERILDPAIIALRHAYEIKGDGIGNDNWLCESDETCIFMPNLGAYQGHGRIDTGQLSIDGGIVSGITLKKYQTNGR